MVEKKPQTLRGKKWTIYKKDSKRNSRVEKQTPISEI